MVAGVEACFLRLKKVALAAWAYSAEAIGEKLNSFRLQSKHANDVLLLLGAIALTLTLSGTSLAFGSGEKTPEEAAELIKKATKEYNKGVKHMDKARKQAQKGDSTYAFNYRATTAAKTKNEYKKAVKRFNKAIKHNDEFPEAFNNLGYCYRKLGKLEESLEAYSKALKLNPDFAQAIEYLGETFLALDSLGRANEQLRRLKKLESSYADTLSKSIGLYRLAQLNIKLENTDK